MARARLIKTVDAHSFRLANDAQRYALARANETANEHISRLASDALRHAQARATETADEHISRRASDALRHAQTRAIENTEVHISRLESDRLRHSELRARETSQEREARLRRQREAYVLLVTDEVDFNTTINTFCDKCCDICQKKCYPNQLVKYRLTLPKSYLPLELSAKKDLLVCHRCNMHLKRSKSHAPSKVHWNNLLPGDISVEIVALIEPERRLLQRIIPYVKVIEFPCRFGQYGFKGHVTLFALDIFEVSEKLPEMLPRSSTDVGIVVTETLENLNVSSDYNILLDRVYKALDWLIANNPLYKRM
ncbi:hypothetical protein AVEN_93446-1 [Araneus ventricosus]|uniref:DUF6570 domain-containing protein n=1 Tax=Araneus ventricosus TaxID=182803 RepID=A0A4Y2APJ4_ARAVE|nr:hypothetical protein AVEN_93446-1 [Araneus ventricosus]